MIGRHGHSAIYDGRHLAFSLAGKVLRRVYFRFHEDGHQKDIACTPRWLSVSEMLLFLLIELVVLIILISDWYIIFKHVAENSLWNSILLRGRTRD